MKLSFKIEAKIKTSQKYKLKQVITTILALLNILKEIVHTAEEETHAQTWKPKKKQVSLKESTIENRKEPNTISAANQQTYKDKKS